MSSSRPPTRNLGITHTPPGAQKAHKEKTPSVPLSGEYYLPPHVPDALREKQKETPPRRPKGTNVPKRPYAELRAASAFSFLDGSSLPEDLIAQAAMQDLPAMALIERNGVYGAPRFFMAAEKTGVTALIRAELMLGESAARGTKQPH